MTLRTLPGLDGQISSFYQKSCQAPSSKIFFFRFTEKYDCPRVPFPHKGAFRDRHERWEGDAMDAGGIN
jgi:hypothetical protein